mmetsp:Transcript_23393/g.67407  ORF Transcript_23393/g.67407 Transcript_23393/m.67407 type:complete len:140 (-) Transcript_23393:544-963(-)
MITMKRPLSLVASIAATSLFQSCGGSEARLYDDFQPALADQQPQQISQPHHHLPSATNVAEDGEVRPIVDGQHRSLQAVNTSGPWPECVGKTGMECKGIIEAANPEMTVHVSHPQKFNYYRVWVHIDENGVVVGKPGRG